MSHALTLYNIEKIEIIYEQINNFSKDIISDYDANEKLYLEYAIERIKNIILITKDIERNKNNIIDFTTLELIDKLSYLFDKKYNNHDNLHITSGNILFRILKSLSIENLISLHEKINNIEVTTTFTQEIKDESLGYFLIVQYLYQITPSPDLDNNFIEKFKKIKNSLKLSNLTTLKKEIRKLILNDSYQQIKDELILLGDLIALKLPEEIIISSTNERQVRDNVFQDIIYPLNYHFLG